MLTKKLLIVVAWSAFLAIASMIWTNVTEVLPVPADSPQIVLPKTPATPTSSVAVADPATAVRYDDQRACSGAQVTPWFNDCDCIARDFDTCSYCRKKTWWVKKRDGHWWCTECGRKHVPVTQYYGNRCYYGRYYYRGGWWTRGPLRRIVSFPFRLFRCRWR